MAVAKKKKVAKVAVVPSEVMPVPVLKKELVLEGDPEQQLQFAHKAASTLMKWVQQKPNPVSIRGEQYLEFGDWQILGRFYGSTVSTEWTRPLERGGKVIGYEARVIVLRDGITISSAEGMCTRDEKRWASADAYAIRSMAQTRTSAKALRNAFGWVAELAGMKSTPVEEMPDVYDQTPVHDEVPVIMVGTDTDETPADPITAQRVRLFALLRARGVDVKDGAACARYVADETQLELVESNFPYIIKALEN